MTTQRRPLPSLATSILVLVLLVTAVWSANAAPVTLRAAVNTSMGAAPYSVVTGDFNGDGKLDAASANYFNDNVAIRFGDGRGGWSGSATFPVGTKPTQVITGFFNNDLFLDLVTVNYQSNNVTVLLNNGSGVFTGTSYAAGVNPLGLASGDFNGDGRADLAIANPVANALTILIASAGGGFNAPLFQGISGSSVQAVAVGLVNGDSNIDLVTANPGTSTISVLTGDGAGGFAVPVSFSTGANSVPTTIALGDFNNDLKLDAIVGTTNNTRVNYFTGNGVGGFSLTSNFTGINPSAVAFSDVDGDSNQDIVATGYNINAVRVIFGNGAGGTIITQDVLSTNHPRSTAIGDFNGDGLKDLAPVGEVTGSISMALNLGARTFPTPFVLVAGSGRSKLVDLNADGKLDLIIGGTFIRLGNGDGTFATAVTYSNTNAGNDFAVGDINNDNRPDVVTSGGTGITVRLNNGNGTLGSPINITTTPGKLGLGDFSGDGKVDLVVGLPTATVNNIQILQGDNLGNFILAAATTVSQGITAVTVADLTNDAKPDLLVSILPPSGPVLTVLVWNGSNSFGAPTSVSNNGCGASQPPAIADFNNDGKLDVGATSICSNGANAAVYLGDGFGGFTLYGAIGMPPSSGEVVAGDFDRDGKMDLAAMCAGEIGVAYAFGGGIFTVTSYASGATGTGTASGDVTGDGVPDIIFSAGNIYLLSSISQPRGRVTADFDGDGKTDISVFVPSSGSWYILRSSTNTFYGVAWGQNGDRPVPGDYDGDGKTDVAVFRGGDWYLLRSSDGGFVFQHHGSPGDIPVPADYNGDGITNFAVYRPSTGWWYTSTNPNTNYDGVQWGAAGDIPSPGDYDGDGRTDVAVFRPTGGIWHILQSTAGYLQIQHGVSTDRPVPADYNGDGKTNIAVFRPSTGFWYTSTDPATNYGAQQWGANGDVLVPGYYDGDNKVDIAVFRNGVWYILSSNNQTLVQYYFGSPGDIPIPSLFVPQ